MQGRGARCLSLPSRRAFCALRLETPREAGGNPSMLDGRMCTISHVLYRAPFVSLGRYTASRRRRPSCSTWEKFSPFSMARALSHAGSVTVRVTDLLTLAMRTDGM